MRVEDVLFEKCEELKNTAEKNNAILVFYFVRIGIVFSAIIGQYILYKSAQDMSVVSILIYLIISVIVGGVASLLLAISISWLPYYLCRFAVTLYGMGKIVLFIGLGAIVFYLLYLLDRILFPLV